MQQLDALEIEYTLISFLKKNADRQQILFV
jgi:hypothetical protein